MESAIHHKYRTHLNDNAPKPGNQDDQKEQARRWYRSLRDQICQGLEHLEEECTLDDMPPGTFERKNWVRRKADPTDMTEPEKGGGGEMSIMTGGRVFEKVGVNISTVYGQFSDSFRGQIPGTQDVASFWASGLSLVAHPRNPHVPPIHMNTRHIITGISWFGGGIDLNPITEDINDSEAFHSGLKALCDAHDPHYYDDFKRWCDDYFYLPHRDEHRGIGGIFYDYLNTGNWKCDFDFNCDVGSHFLNAYKPIVRRHMNKNWSAEEREHQLIRRGRYAEFNLLYDRGTVFGLKTGGHTEAILMSLPPEVKWP